MTVQGSAGATSTSVAIPAHAAGDLILVFVRNASNTVATTPAAGGTVPAWNVLQTGGANTLSLVSAYFVATASTTTTGTWTGATHIVVLVLRPASGNTISVRGSSTGNGAAVTTVVYPALTTLTDGSTWGVRIGCRGPVATEMATVPSAGWVNQIVWPAGSGAVLGVHTFAGLTSSPAADTVTTTGTSGAYRAHTIEVAETSAGALNVSKTNAYTVLSSIAGLNVSKVNAYAVLVPAAVERVQLFVM